MKVQEVMSTNVKSCSEDANLATAARLMWDGDCGIVPVVDNERHVTGVVTDRDICIAAATRAVPPAEIRVRDVISHDVATCTPIDDVRNALATLGHRRVRRLPVVDTQGRLVGIVSLNDIVIRAECRRGAEIPGDEFIDTMKAIGAHAAAIA